MFMKAVGLSESSRLCKPLLTQLHIALHSCSHRNRQATGEGSSAQTSHQKKCILSECGRGGDYRMRGLGIVGKALQRTGAGRWK